MPDSREYRVDDFTGTPFVVVQVYDEEGEPLRNTNLSVDTDQGTVEVTTDNDGKALITSKGEIRVALPDSSLFDNTGESQ